MILRIAPALFLAAAAAPAFAADVAFHYDGGELASAAGVESMYARLAYRVEAACSAKDLRGIWRLRAEEQCSDALLADLIASIGDTNLAAVHEQSHDTWLAISND